LAKKQGIGEGKERVGVVYVLIVGQRKKDVQSAQEVSSVLGKGMEKKGRRGKRWGLLPIHDSQQ